MIVADSNNKTSILIPTQLPEFVREDHNTFVQFIQSYYKFLENTTYEKSVKSNLTVSTKIGPAGAYQNTNVVFLSANVAVSNVAIANGTKISIDGNVTYANNVFPDSQIIEVDINVPTRIVEGDLHVYTSQYTKANSNLLSVTKNWPRLLDIDVAATDNEYVKQKLYDNFVSVLPKNIIADKTLIAKHAREFYRSKGSENSVKFLLRALYNAESSFYYPKQDILRASDGKWKIEKSIRITDTKIDSIANTAIFNNFVNKKITGVSSGAEAIVEGINLYYRNGRLITELLISNTVKPFFANEEIYAFFQDTPTSRPKKITANIFGGQIVDTQIINGGTGYLEGMIVPVIPTDNTGNGARIQISRVSRGGINRIFVGANTNIGLPDFGGVGYRVEDLVVITGGGGRGAVGGIESVWDNNLYHPNTYSLSVTTLNDVANYRPSDFWDNVPNLSIGVGETVANSIVGDSIYYWNYGPTGPAKFCYVVNEGEDYGSGLPSFRVQANSTILSLGILGKLKINNGGSGYVVGDTIEFINTPTLSYGQGASANVTSVSANGAITGVKFNKLPGQFAGGSGYLQEYLPTCNVVSDTGNGANIVVTNILGTGGEFSFTTENLGIIKAIAILDGGLAYNNPPILDLTGLGDGKAQVIAKSITGVYTYPGRYINQDGFLSSKNKLEDRDYYQNFSYVIKSKATINRYGPILKSLTHPAGTKMFGVYEISDDAQAYINVTASYDTSNSVTVSESGLSVYLDTANTIDPWTGRPYQFNIYDSGPGGDFHIFTEGNLYVRNQALSTDGTAYDTLTTWVNLANMDDIGTILNGAIINPESGVLKFDGTNEYAFFNVNEELNSQNLTCEVWFASDRLLEDGYLFEKGFRNDQYSILIQKNRQTVDSDLIWRLNLDGNVTDAIKVSTTEYLRSGWNYIATTHTSGNQTMFVNGSFVNKSNNSVGLMPKSPAGLSVACSGTTSGIEGSRTYFFEGSIGIIRIYRRVLSNSEIMKNYNRDKGRYGQ